MDKRLVPILGLLTSVMVAPVVWAHGVVVDYRIGSDIEIEATYDSGAPVANAQVEVYAPDAPTRPWLTGTADPDGHFSFTPPPDHSGTWQIRVRQAGHGTVLNVPVASNRKNSVQTASSQETSPIQRRVMSIVVIGGFILTAIFFSTRKR